MLFQLTFIVNSVLIVVVGFIMWRSILPEPLRTNNSSLDRLETSEPIVEEEDGETLHQPISMVNALILPNVLPVGRFRSVDSIVLVSFI